MNESIQKLLQRIPELRGRPFQVAPLTGGLTNLNYRIDSGGESYALRIAGANAALLGIDRACEAAFARRAAELDIGPEVIATLPDHGLLVTRFLPGQVLAPEEIRQPANLRRVVTALRRCHDGPAAPGRFSPFTTIRCYHVLARERGVTFPESLPHAMERLAGVEAELAEIEPPCLCHNDLLAGNFIDDGEAVRIIDWEYAGMGDRFFDLGNLAVNNAFGDDCERELLRLYFGEVQRDHQRRLQLMRQVSDLREAMWGFLQAGISTLAVDYPTYGRKHLDRFLSVRSDPD